MASNEQVIDELCEFVIEVNLTIQLMINQAVEKTIIDLETLIQQMKLSGASDDAIREVLMQDLKTGGKIFGTFKNQFKATADLGIGKMSQLGSVYELDKRGLKEYKWQRAGKNICPDCKSRHGQTGSWDEWALFGLPKSGFSVCGAYCNCDLVPTGEWQKDPLKIPLEGEGINRRQSR